MYRLDVDFYAAPDMAFRYALPDLPMCCHRANLRSDPIGFTAVWLQAGIHFSPPLCHQFRRHYAVGVLYSTTAVSACNAGFTACRFIAWVNGIDGSK